MGIADDQADPASHLSVSDQCTGVDHFPDPPPRDDEGNRIQAPSVVVVGLTIRVPLASNRFDERSTPLETVFIESVSIVTP